MTDMADNLAPITSDAIAAAIRGGVIVVRVVDVAAEAREMFGDEGARMIHPDMPEHDCRLVMDTPTGGEVTFHRGATADSVMAYAIREGWVR